MKIDKKIIEELVGYLKEFNLSEIEYAEGTTKVKVSRAMNNSSIISTELNKKKTIIENNVQIGSYSDIEGSCKISSYAKLHSNVHVGQKSIIMSYAWLFPYVILTNDPIPPSYIRQGVVIEPFAIVCTRSTILPGKKIGFGSFVGANSLVNNNLETEMIGSGNPFKVRGSINKIKDPNTKESAYPWISRITNRRYFK